MNKYKYTQHWFLNSEIHQNLKNILNKTQQNNILKIGCFEGLSSVFFADNFLENELSSLNCVDPFLNDENNDHKIYLQNEEEKNFDYNLTICKNNEKIIVHKITSDDFFKINDQTYNFIYIDGCHLPPYITRDMENSFVVLRKGGIMWMDDYGGGDRITIKKTMDNFLEKYKGKYKLIHKGYQLAIQKL